MSIVIIGAGLTGLSTAYHLEKRGFFDYVLFEKDPTVGGLCRSVQENGFTFDYTGHLLHASDPYFQNFIKDTIGYDNLHSINRRSFIYSHNTFTKYPFQVNLFGLPPSVIIECIAGFARRSLKKKCNNFPEWVLANFGVGIAKHFFFPFQKKIFAHPLNNVTCSWMGRFVPNTSLEQLIQGALSAPAESSLGYNAHFYYPKQGGINAWITTIAQKLSKPVLTNYEITTIDMAKKVISFANGDTQPYDILINTMPLDLLLERITDKTTTRLHAAASKLTCNSVVNFNLGIARAKLSSKHWIYFPEGRYPFYRLGFTHNFASSMAPEGCSSLYGEFSHIKASYSTIKRKLKASLEQVQELFSLDDQEIIAKKIISIPHAYVIYTHWREKNLPKLHSQLQACDIFSIGRYGEWKYSSMQEAILDGKRMAEQLTIVPAHQQPIYFDKSVPNQLMSKEL